MLNRDMDWKEALFDFFSQGIKRTPSRLLGVEAEHFIVKADTNEAVPYAGENGVREILGKLMALFPGALPLPGEDFFGFSTEDFAITPEPAAQLEISMAQTESVNRVEEIKALYPTDRRPVSPDCQDDLWYF